MLKPTALANSVTVVSIGIYIACRLLSLLTPGLLFSIGESWFHTFNLDSDLATSPLDLGVFLVGTISLGALSWIMTYAVAALYNKMAR